MIVQFRDVVISKQVGVTSTPDASLERINLLCIAIESLSLRTSSTSKPLSTKFITHSLSVSLIDISDVLSFVSLKCSLRKAVL